MKTTRIVAFCLPVALLMSVSCGTLSNLIGKPTYDPASYGTTALIQTVRSPKSNSSDSTTAARQLALRNLSEKEGRELMTALVEHKDWRTRVALLKTMQAKQMTYLRDELAAYSLKAPDAETAVEASATVVALTADSTEALTFSTALLMNGKYPEVRARSARLITTNFPESAEEIFSDALKNETSASAATFMCEFLAQKGSAKSLQLLDEIANNVNRQFKADNLLGVKTSAESVRAAAVRGAERLREY